MLGCTCDFNNAQTITSTVSYSIGHCLLNHGLFGFYSFLCNELCSSSLISLQGKGGPYCEFRVRVQADRTTLLESVKNPLQFVTIGPDGSPGEVRGILDKEPTRRFYVYAKVSVSGIMLVFKGLKTETLNL